MVGVPRRRSVCDDPVNIIFWAYPSNGTSKSTKHLREDLQFTARLLLGSAMIVRNYFPVPKVYKHDGVSI